MIRYILFYLFILIISSCMTLNLNNKINKTPKFDNSKDLISKINLSNINPEFILLKGKLNFTKDKRSGFPLNISIKIKKDSIIWASITAPFGIELFRAMATKDSLYYINRTQKSFFVKKISHIEELLNTELSFNDLQQILTGQIDIKFEDYDFTKDFYSSDSVRSLASNSDISVSKLNFEDEMYLINSDTYRVISFSRSIDDFLLSIRYDYLPDFRNGIFPESVYIETNTNYSISFEYKKIVLDTPQSFSFKIPISYVKKL